MNFWLERKIIFYTLIDYLNFEYDKSNEERKKLVDEYIELNYKKDLVEKIKDRVPEVRKNEELNEFLVEEERNFFNNLIDQLIWEDDKSNEELEKLVDEYKEFEYQITNI